MKIVNLTPHKLDIYVGSTEKITVEPSGIVVRCEERRELVGTLRAGDDDIPVYYTVFGAVQDLPEPQDGVIYVVSALVLQALNGTRPDVFAPGKSVRDKSGNVIGCEGLSASRGDLPYLQGEHNMFTMRNPHVVNYLKSRVIGYSGDTNTIYYEREAEMSDGTVRTIYERARVGSNGLYRGDGGYSLVKPRVAIPVPPKWKETHE